MSVVSVSLPRSAHPRRLAEYAQDNRIPTVVFLVGLLVLLRSARNNWRLPTRRESAGFILTSLVLVGTASVLPTDLVTLFLWATLVAMAFDNGPLILSGINKVTGLLNATPVGGRIAHGFTAA